MAFNRVGPDCPRCDAEMEYVEDAQGRAWMSGAWACPACGHAEEQVNEFDEQMAKD